MKVGILVPVCSRNQPWTHYEECFFHTTLWQSFQATKSEGYEYVFYIGLDDDDAFFLKYRDQLPGISVLLTGCQHAPAHAWNILFQRAYEDGCDYFFQLADDVVLETPGWTERFLSKLLENKNLGVVGPCHPENYEGRRQLGQPFVIENACVHRRHYDLFHTFYPTEIRNWYCDDWITRVYEGTLSHMFPDILVRNRSIHVTAQRYAIANVDLAGLLVRDKAILRRHLRGCFSFCLYGSFFEKYYRGLQENVALIREHYPTWDVVVYAAPEAEAFVQSLGIQCVPTGKTGAVNMTYRFLPVTNPEYDVVCVRDTDSRIHARDRWCIDNFLESSYRMYTIRDHPYHHYRIMGGLWGKKRGVSFDPRELVAYCEQTSAGYTTDTRFLETHLNTQDLIVYSYVSHGLFYDPMEKVKLIECSLPNHDFCGNVVLYRDDGSSYTQFTQV